MIRVLLVDDHEVVRRGLQLLLETSDDIEVVGEASDGAEALSAVEQTQPDVVLMDIRMPRVDGIEATERLRVEHPGVAVVILTTYNEDELLLRGLRAGARGYLLKDEPAQEILAAIDAVMTGRTYFSAAVSLRLSQASAPATLLTQRERDVLRHIASGHANKQIAQALGLSVRTVETHRLNIKRKLGIDGQAELIKYAVENRGV